MLSNGQDEFYTSILNRQSIPESVVGGKQVASRFLEELFSILFSGYHSERNFSSKDQIMDQLELFRIRWKNLLEPYASYADREFGRVVALDDILHNFVAKLPGLYQWMWEDAEAAFLGDPAAESIHEVILAYSGFYAGAVHRVANYFFKSSLPIFPKLLSGVAHEATGIDIHPGAEIGRAFFMDHGTGIVIGETTQIADNVKIYQGVTLGALSVNKSLAKQKRHPTIEEGVVIYAGATILGGETVIGKQSIIGGNAWITQSIPPYSVVYQKSEVRVRSSNEIQGLDFTI
ncbi:serine O-acetyltransferase EpsC [Leptospira terpstrae]|uniref:Serine O-acetyltransferase n=1 Tax=Leptospira terpstrae serovar Hualin str. LT 11-33 = ATCC 700639 TaxID=1257025 RepID=N1VL46_9LEPT|nr:serine O-acetyltransferase EpsC [Leptospira terpstrae]EMY60424.1 putative serine O-acetyltransferase [Leptospira terpstrae serovar Hualin str. LT 11-33 = ATCC 700639]